MFGFSQVIGHDIVFPTRSREYSPGAVTALLLHAPIGAAWIQEQRRNGGFTRADLVKTAALLVGFVAVGVIGPQRLFGDPDSPYPIALHQVRPADRQAAAAAGRRLAGRWTSAATDDGRTSPAPSTAERAGREPRSSSGHAPPDPRRMRRG